jgi:hypothetical protein
MRRLAASGISFFILISGTNDSGWKLNVFLIAAVLFVSSSHASQNSLTAQEVLERCRARTSEIDKGLKNIDLQFTQEIEFKSRGGENDDLVFNITVRHGTFERQIVSSTVANGDRFNGGYDVFDKMFLLSEYFDEQGKSLTSCEFQRAECSNCYGISFILSKSSDLNDPLNVVSASISTSDFTPMTIYEEITGLPLGAEFDNDVKVSYDRDLNMCYPEDIVMRVYAHLFFLKGEIAVVTIKNRNLKRI